LRHSARECSPLEPVKARERQTYEGTKVMNDTQADPDATSNPNRSSLRYAQPPRCSHQGRDFHHPCPGPSLTRQLSASRPVGQPANPIHATVSSHGARRVSPSPDSRLGALNLASEPVLPSNKSLTIWTRRSTAYRAAHTASARPSYENRPSSQLAVADMLRTMRHPSVSPQCGDDSALTCDASRRLALLPESAPQCCMSRTTIVVAGALALAAEFPAKSLARPVREELGFWCPFPSLKLRSMVNIYTLFLAIQLTVWQQCSNASGDTNTTRCINHSSSYYDGPKSITPSSRHNRGQFQIPASQPAMIAPATLHPALGVAFRRCHYPARGLETGS
jgi:hypothetical protein